MAFDGRRTMLSGLDMNVSHAGAGLGGSGGMANAPPKAGRASSMIPRHSVAPPHGRPTVADKARSSIAPHQVQSHMQAQTPFQQTEKESWASHSVSGTPHMKRSVRQSVAPSSSSQPRMSVAQTPNAARKSMGRPSLAPRGAGMGGGSGYSKPHVVDPRPIREDRTYLTRMESEIQEFLVQTGFTFPPKYSGEFHMPSQALVMSAFRHLYHQCIDLRFVFNAEPKKEVEEVLLVLSDIKYPLITELSKTKLSAPGSIHNWPPICGMLHWLVCLESSLDPVTTKYHGGPLERPVSQEDEDFCHYFPYLWRCYEQFWQSKDEYPEEQAKLEQIFEEKSQQAREDVEGTLSEIQTLQARLRDLEENDSPLEIEMKEKQVLESDVKKFIEYRDSVLLPRIQQYRSVVEKLKADTALHVDEVEKRTSERDRLRKEVDAQDVSADDFEVMSRERESLAKQVEEVMNRLLDKSAANGHSEILLSNKQARVEDELKALSDKCREIGLFPFSLPDGRQLYDFEMHAGNTATMLPKGLDFRNDVRERIQARGNEVKKEYRTTMSRKVKEQEAYDLLLEDVEEKQGEAEKMEMRLRSVREQWELANTASKEEARIQAESEAKNGLALAQIDQAGRLAVDQAESRLRGARLQLNHVRERDTVLRKQLHDEFVVGLETILSLKSTVTEGLQALQEVSASAKHHGKSSKEL